MASSRRALLPNEPNSPTLLNDPGRELFEACRNGDLSKVKKLVTPHNVNAKDTAGRKSSPLHFAAGKCRLFSLFDQRLFQFLSLTFLDFVLWLRLNTSCEIFFFNFIHLYFSG